MQKTIELLSLDTAALTWLKERLYTEITESPYGYDILEALEKLQSGKADGVLLQLDGVTRETPVEDRVITCGMLSIYPKKRRIVRQGMEVILTPKEFDILYFLARNRGEVFTKEQIYRAVWDSDYPMDDNNIMAFIRKLRKKIEPDPDAPQYILTIWGVGYTFSEHPEISG